MLLYTIIYYYYTSIIVCTWYLDDNLFGLRDRPLALAARAVLLDLLPAAPAVGARLL
jgi:hypothetical protein